MSTGVVTELRFTAAHYEADLDIDAVSGFRDEVRHHKPVVGVSSHCQVTDRVHSLDVTVRRCVTRFLPLTRRNIQRTAQKIKLAKKF